MKYESSILNGLKVMTKVKVFVHNADANTRAMTLALRTFVPARKKLWYHMKGLSQGIHMCNIKALSRLLRKLWPRLKFFKSRSNFKVKVTRSKIMVP